MYDLTVTHIANVYYRESETWKRDNCISRAFNAIVLFTEGEIEYHFSDRTIVAQKGDLLLLPGDVPYWGKKLSKKTSYYVLDFTCLTKEEYAAIGAPCTATPVDYNNCLINFQNAVEIWKSQDNTANFKIRSFLYFLLSEINMHEKKDICNSQTLEIINFISENYSNPKFTVKEICEKFFISESQLRRNIIKATGYNTNGYILSLRINKAKNLLLHTGEPVKQISEKCGFVSQYYFSRCFTKTVGMSPVKYRALTAI